jgi:hypothetical protein
MFIGWIIAFDRPFAGVLIVILRLVRRAGHLCSLI